MSVYNLSALAHMFSIACQGVSILIQIQLARQKLQLLKDSQPCLVPQGLLFSKAFAVSLVLGIGIIIVNLARVVVPALLRTIVIMAMVLTFSIFYIL